MQLAMLQQFTIVRRLVIVDEVLEARVDNQRRFFRRWCGVMEVEAGGDASARSTTLGCEGRQTESADR